MSQFIKGITWGLVRVRVHNPEVVPLAVDASQVAGSGGDAAEEARARSL